MHLQLKVANFSRLELYVFSVGVAMAVAVAVGVHSRSMELKKVMKSNLKRGKGTL